MALLQHNAVSRLREAFGTRGLAKSCAALVKCTGVDCVDATYPRSLYTSVTGRFVAAQLIASMLQAASLDFRREPLEAAPRSGTPSN